MTTNENDLIGEPLDRLHRIARNAQAALVQNPKDTRAAQALANASDAIRSWVSQQEQDTPTKELDLGKGTAFASGAANAASLGLMSGTQETGPLSGLASDSGHPVKPEENEFRTTLEASRAQHPIMTGAGEVAGSVPAFLAGEGEAKAGLSALEQALGKTIPVALKKALMRSAAGAAVPGVEAGNETGDLGKAKTAAEIGGIAAPILGAGGDAITGSVGYGSRLLRALSEKLGIRAPTPPEPTATLGKSTPWSNSWPDNIPPEPKPFSLRTLDTESGPSAEPTRGPLRPRRAAPLVQIEPSPAVAPPEGFEPTGAVPRDNTYTPKPIPSGEELQGSPTLSATLRGLADEGVNQQRAATAKAADIWQAARARLKPEAPALGPTATPAPAETPTPTPGTPEYEAAVKDAFRRTNWSRHGPIEPDAGQDFETMSDDQVNDLINSLKQSLKKKASGA